MEKRKLVRLLLSEGLTQDKPGEIMEDIASKNIEELVGLGMLQEFDHWIGRLEVSSRYRKLSVRSKVKKQEFVTVCANSPLRVMINDDGTDIPPNFNNLLIQSLFVWRIGYEKRLSGAYLRSVFCRLKFLVVLDLQGQIEYLADEVGDLIHLRYLCLENSDLDALPGSIGNLQKLQTLDIGMYGKLKKLPSEVLNIRGLRHLIIPRRYDGGETRVPRGIGTLVNLHTCCGLYAGGGIAIELSCLTQLRELKVKCVSDDHASELFASIMKMVDLVSLSLEVESAYFAYTKVTLLPSSEAFSPPPLLQDLYLVGALVEMPEWLGSMGNLTKLTLNYSFLSENPTSVLQFLPKLKHLILCYAYEAKDIGREFCEAGRFPKLETLTITSDSLFEWTEVENGAFPSLRYLSFRHCPRLRFLPEGLQYISTLQELRVYPLHPDLERRLNGKEEYKIKHIPKVVLKLSKQ